MQSTLVKVSQLKNNSGQVPGLPANPRFIKDERFQKLVKSLKDDPEMLGLREVIAYDHSGELVVIAGNMRLKACQEIGIKEVPTKILPADTNIEKLKAYTIKDNVPFGETDWSMIANEWDTEQVTEWGLDIPDFPNTKVEGRRPLLWYDIDACLQFLNVPQPLIVRLSSYIGFRLYTSKNASGLRSGPISMYLTTAHPFC